MKIELGQQIAKYFNALGRVPQTLAVTPSQHKVLQTAAEKPHTYEMFVRRTAAATECVKALSFMGGINITRTPDGTVELSRLGEVCRVFEYIDPPSKGVKAYRQMVDFAENTSWGAVLEWDVPGEFATFKSE